MRLPRRLKQISLRASLILFLVLSIILAHRANRAHHARQAVAHIESLGGTVHYDYEFDPQFKVTTTTFTSTTSRGGVVVVKTRDEIGRAS